MDAVVVHGKEDYRWETVPVPKPGSKELLVKVAAVGICAGDAKCFAGADRFWGEPSYCEPPVTPGHEFSGYVVALGPGAEEHHGVKEGDLVVAEQIIPCQKCRYCLIGEYQMCPDHSIFGFHQKSPGAMASYMIFPEKARVHKIPATVNPVFATFIEPFACSLHGVELANIQFNDVVVISGCGPIGLGMVVGAKMKNPKIVVALDLVDWKLDIAKKCGADLTFNPSKCDVKKEIEKLSSGYGCDVYLEASGHPSSVIQGLDIIASLGRFIEFSVFGSKVTADWSIIGDVKEIRIIGGHLGPHCWPKAIDLISNGHVPVDEIVTHKFPLRNFLEGIKKVSNSQDSIKVMLFPGEI